MNKLTEVLIRKLGITTNILDTKSQNVIKTFTDAIENIDKVNERIDREVEEATNIVVEVEKQKDKLNEMKQQNLNIKEKIKNIIS